MNGKKFKNILQGFCAVKGLEMVSFKTNVLNRSQVQAIFTLLKILFFANNFTF